MRVETNDVNRLRQMILKHQWKETCEIASTLFAQDVPQFTGFIADQLMRSYLRFRTRYDLVWVARFAQELIDSSVDKLEEKSRPELPHEVHGTFADAPFGVTSLVGVVVELHKGYSKSLSTDEKGWHLAIAQDKCIVAEISNYWELVYSEAIRLKEMFGNAQTTTEGRKLLPNEVDKKELYRGVGFLIQPESNAYRAARWLNVVDEIELRLNL